MVIFLVEGGLEGVGNLVFVIVLVIGYEDSEVFFVGQRVLFVKDFDDFRVGELFRDFFVGFEVVVEFSIGDVYSLGIFGDFVGGYVFVFVRDVDYFLEFDYFDIKFFLVFLYKMLSIVRIVVIFVVFVFVGVGVVMIDNEVGCIVVFVDDGVLDSFMGIIYVYGEGKKGEGGYVVRVVGQEGFVDMDMGEVVNVIRFG